MANNGNFILITTIRTLFTYGITSTLTEQYSAFILQTLPTDCSISIKIQASRLGGVVVSMIATGPKGHGFKPGQGKGFLRAIKICRTPSFRWEVKPEIPCRKILWHVKDLFTYQRY
jgi:hypothetical protein